MIIGANFRTFSGLLGLSRAWKIADNGMQCFKMITKSPCGPSNCTRMPKQQIVSKLYVVVCAGWMIDFEKLDSSCDCALGTANTTQSAHGVSKLYVKMISYVCGAKLRGDVCQHPMTWNYPKFRLCFKIDARSDAFQFAKRAKQRPWEVQNSCTSDTTLLCVCIKSKEDTNKTTFYFRPQIARFQSMWSSIVNASPTELLCRHASFFIVIK